MVRSIVIYHSHTGNVDAVARSLSDKIGADIVRLTIPGTESLCGARMYIRLGFLAKFRRRPKIHGGNVDLSGYDTVIFGSPVWAGTFSPALRSFLYKRRLAEGTKFAAYFCHKGGLRQAPARLAEYLNLVGKLRFVAGIDVVDEDRAAALADALIAEMAR